MRDSMSDRGWREIRVVVKAGGGGSVDCGPSLGLCRANPDYISVVFNAAAAAAAIFGRLGWMLVE
jgi:hypothetical protein